MKPGDIIRAERLRQGKTLDKVASRAAISVPYLSDVERGQRHCSLRAAVDIAAALLLPPERLVAAALDEKLAPLGLECTVRQRMSDDDHARELDVRLAEPFAGEVGR